MLEGVKEASYSVAFEITLMQSAMIQASYIKLTGVISLLSTLVLASPPTHVITMHITITYIIQLHMSYYSVH